jgi:hypothetical protein
VAGNADMATLFPSRGENIARKRTAAKADLWDDLWGKRLAMAISLSLLVNSGDSADNASAARIRQRQDVLQFCTTIAAAARLDMARV